MSFSFMFQACSVWFKSSTIEYSSFNFFSALQTVVELRKKINSELWSNVCKSLTCSALFFFPLCSFLIQYRFVWNWTWFLQKITMTASVGTAVIAELQLYILLYSFSDFLGLHWQVLSVKEILFLLGLHPFGFRVSPKMAPVWTFLNISCSCS